MITLLIKIILTKREKAVAHQDFLENLYKMLDYAPELTSDVTSLAFDKMLQIDVFYYYYYFTIIIIFVIKFRTIIIRNKKRKKKSKANKQTNKQKHLIG